MAGLTSWARIPTCIAAAWLIVSALLAADAPTALYESLDLPDEVQQKVYRGSAIRLLKIKA